MNNKNQESLDLSSEILRNIELAEIPLSNIITKTIRLARLIGDLETVNWLRLEISGYCIDSISGVPPIEWEYGAKSKRHYLQKDKDGKEQSYMKIESVGRIESEIETAKIQLSVSTDPNISISSSNPNQYLHPPNGNTVERNNLRLSILNGISLLDKIKSSILEYVLSIYYQLKFSDITESIFENTKNRVNLMLSTICPEATKELVTAYENVLSLSEADWSNSANSCRRLLVQVADVLCPSVKSKVTKNTSKPKLTEDAYVNRLINFIASKSKSENFQKVVGSHLKFIGERLDSLNSFSSKGLHKKISKDEIERLIIYTFLCVGDILTLVPKDFVKK